MFRQLLLAVLLTASGVTHADCFDMAGRDYHIDPDLIRAVSFRESSYRTDALNTSNHDGYAVGLMQIYSSNFTHLSQFGITPDNLYRDPCMNIYTGAYYLAIAFKRWGYNWRAVGAYNAGFANSKVQEKKRQVYAQEVRAIYTTIRARSENEKFKHQSDR
ncbi:transglycosylase SLT domain-containing protein [Scandinavium goeteborgense]|uniref:Transglycosylase-like protein with SLT domain n=1 Tax=Scandinavium goeteborgense TaxID=1851514 RepID=A0A4R6E1A5_SCAGO|nr:transglycosylase SLT domain-containing protein [Scandinavium goeteborgense]TDN51506.1 transglycosylase-like protein with SLT domain [Scandinavium goeteborgense]